ncbi:MAG: TssQ family T6SS-associated lipoprotein [Burkholderiales bacterium]|nr:TssQ family T6SS-associated lipoprotein [Burkholderiales bacterium]
MNGLTNLACRAALATALALLAACATPPPPEPAPTAAPIAPPVAPASTAPPPAPPPPPPPSATDELAVGIKSYDDGDYKAAALHLQAALDMGLDRASDRAQAHKYRAFMACVTGRERPCRDEFHSVLEADPDFALAPAEATHPVWPKVLASVKTEMARAAARKAPAKGTPPKSAPPKSAPAKSAPATPAAPAGGAPPAVR